MIKKTPWTSRKFNFDFPVSHFPFIYVRLTGTSARIESIIKGFSEKQLEHKEEGKWSVKEHIGHLADLDDLHEGRLIDYRNKAETLRPADMSNLKTNEANHNSTSIDQLLSNFRNKRNHFLKLVESLDEQALSQSTIHPRLQQPMRLVDMAFFVAEHDDQHLAIMMEILNRE